MLVAACQDAFSHVFLREATICFVSVLMEIAFSNTINSLELLVLLVAIYLIVLRIIFVFITQTQLILLKLRLFTS